METRWLWYSFVIFIFFSPVFSEKCDFNLLINDRGEDIVSFPGNFLVAVNDANPKDSLFRIYLNDQLLFLRRGEFNFSLDLLSEGQYSLKVECEKENYEKNSKTRIILIKGGSEFALLDVKVNIIDKYKFVNPGDSVIAEIDLTNMGTKKRFDVIIDYLLKKDKELVYTFRETRAIETTLTITKSFLAGEPGDYTLEVIARYEDKEAEGHDSFTVINPESSCVLFGINFGKFIICTYWWIAIFIVFFVISVGYWFKYRKEEE